ncbi:HpcH/HpaI aldolase family protein [Kineococcus glutinatus]|uniref:Aldolase/citrate lyase family protein n=1 Tax=Kineococcus glutinatus TaxID=1070872 RepID=A0ABP9H4J4_9ACTN
MPHPLLPPPADRPLYGGWSMLANAAAVGSMARAGFDWVLLDTQHGEHDDRSVRECLATSRGAAPVLVRPATCDPHEITRYLDAGAAGVVVPMVSTVEQARAAVRACRYGPAGTRSWGPHAIHCGLRFPTPAEADANVLCAVMVETREGLRNVEAIAAVEGVDVVFVGPFDLSLSLELDVEDLLAADGPEDPLPAVLRACAEAGVVAGAFGVTAERSARLRDLGFRFIAAATDCGLVQSGARERLAGLALPAQHPAVTADRVLSAR